MEINLILCNGLSSKAFADPHVSIEIKKREWERGHLGKTITNIHLV